MFLLVLATQGYVTPLYGSLLSTCGGPNFIQTVFSNVVKLCHLHRLVVERDNSVHNGNALLDDYSESTFS